MYIYIYIYIYKYIGTKFSLPRKGGRANFGKNDKGVYLLLPQHLLDDLNHILNTNIKSIPHFIRISLSKLKNFYLLFEKHQ